jgi:putative membrane protein
MILEAVKMSVSLQSVFAFGLYLLVAVVLLALHTKIYTMITPHDEFKLIRDGKLAASIALGGTIIGFSIPLAGVISHSLSVIDVVIWGVIASVVQLLVFFVASRIVPELSKRIEDNSIAAGTFVAALAIALGSLNTACMTPDTPQAPTQVIEIHQ